MQMLGAPAEVPGVEKEADFDQEVIPQGDDDVPF
jgi:hypothetical protein